LSGAFQTRDDLIPADRRHAHPRFQEGNFEKNLGLLAPLRALAQAKGATMAQIAIAWALARGNDIVPIPGTKRLKYLDDNLGAYYSFASTPPSPAAATSLTLQTPPTSITYGETPLVTAVLSSGPTGISGAPLTFSVAGTATAATTGAGGSGNERARLTRSGCQQFNIA
jgi:hypothetical protein